MRTKTLLLTAALVAAGVATSMAQSNVYSLNVVGYVNVPIQAGFNMVCNPLDVGDNQGNNLTNVIPNGTGATLPDSTFLYPWSGSSYGSIQQYIGGYGWFDPASPDGVTITNKIPPGAGFFILSPSATNITFVGTVVQGGTTNHLGAGFTMVGDSYPLSIPLGAAGDGLGSATMQLPVQDSDFAYIFTAGNGPGHGYEIYQYIGGYGWFDPNNANLSTNGPSPAVAQGFFTLKGAAANWVQNFTVN